jgi:D-serine deaminase-like pyridoxal phosphate-dependent protein
MNERLTAPTTPQPARVRLFDSFSTPVLVLHEAAARHNIALMAAYCQSRKVALAPHAKTSMTPYLIHRQMAAGAWGMTAASMRQARHLLEMGVKRVLLANEVLDSGDLRWLTDYLASAESDIDVLCYVDSFEGLAQLESAAAPKAAGRPGIGVLVELGYDGGRTGVRSVEAGLELARAVRHAEPLQLRGIAGYEGLLPRHGAQTPPGLPRYLQRLQTLLRACHAEALFDTTPLISAGGSSYFDLVTHALGPANFTFDTLTVLRSGCYVTHDDGLYQEISPMDGRREDDSVTFWAALELIGTVLSRPEDGLAIVNFGRRHAPTDDRLPLVKGVLDPDGRQHPLPGALVRRVDDEHCYVDLPDGAQVVPGDRLTFGISHPCGAFDRWREIPVVDAGYNLIEVAMPRF